MPEKCVVFGCSNVPNSKEGIALHPIPFYGKDDPQKRKRRKKWVDFVQLKRAHWTPSKHSHVCSKHFREDDFTVRILGLMEEDVGRRLRRDEIGVCVFPTIQSSDSKAAESKRSKRKVRYYVGRSSVSSRFERASLICFLFMKAHSLPI